MARVLYIPLLIAWRLPPKVYAIREDSDQTVWMRRLIWVFAGRTRLNVDFVVRWLTTLIVIGLFSINYSLTCNFTSAKLLMSSFWISFSISSVKPLSKTQAKYYIETKYNRISIARTPMARLPWLIRTRFWVPTNSSDSSRQKYLRIFFLFYQELYVVCTH